MTSVRFVADGELVVTGSADKVGIFLLGLCFYFFTFWHLLIIHFNFVIDCLVFFFLWNFCSTSVNAVNLWHFPYRNYIIWHLQTVRVWQGSESGNYDCRHVLKDHTAEVKIISFSLVDYSLRPNGWYTLLFGTLFKAL